MPSHASGLWVRVAGVLLAFDGVILLWLGMAFVAALAMMLGAARPTVTVVAGTLQRAGLITYRRGTVTIVDRKRLESASCE